MYRIGPNDVHMNTQLFLANIFNAIGNAYFIALICFYAMDGNVVSRFGVNGYFWQDSTLMLCIVVMVTNLRILQSTSNHTLAGTIIVTLSTFSFFAQLSGESSIPYFNDVYLLFAEMFTNYKTYLILVLCCWLNQSQFIANNWFWLRKNRMFLSNFQYEKLAKASNYE